MRRVDPSLLAILAFAALIFGAGVQWGLPHNESWEADSLTPYHPLIGLSQLFSFGYFNKYPLVHQALLSILQLPVVAVAAARSFAAGSFRPYRFIEQLMDPAYATPLLLIGALTSVVMAVTTVFLVYRLVAELWGRPAGLFAAALACCNTGLNRFAHVAKVEVPHVFWAMLSLLFLQRAVRHGRTRDYVWSALAACGSFGSKDQAYAIFVLPFATYLLLYPALTADPPQSLVARVATRKLAAFGAAFAVGTLLCENVLLNASGLSKRFAHLTGDAGFRSAAYSADLQGSLALLWDFNATAMQAMGGPAVYALGLLGVVRVIRTPGVGRAERWVGLLPLLAGASSYLFFVQLIKQSSDRFALFAGVAAACYAGLGAAWLWSWLWPRQRVLAVIGLLGIALPALVRTARIDVDLAYDVRQEAERWLGDRVPSGARVEYYSSRHFLPRFPAGARAYQIKRGAADVARRHPDLIVLSSLDYDRYLGDALQAAIGGRLTLTIRRTRDRRGEFPDFYRRLFGGELGYRELVRFERRFAFERVSSVPQTIRIFGPHGRSRS
jgi:hypothetical protein